MERKNRSAGRPATVAARVLVGLEKDDVRRLDALIAAQKAETGVKVGRGVALRSCMRIGLDALEAGQ